MTLRRLRLIVLTLTTAPLLAISGNAQTIAWEGIHGDGKDWFDYRNWNPQQIPGEDDQVAIAAGANILLTNSTAALADFVMTGGTLTFTNWSTALNAVNVSVSGGTFTLPPAFTDTEMSNRVYVVCSNFTLGVNASINVSSRGYKASLVSGGTAYGEGAPPVSAHYGGGGGHGGKGGPGSSAGATGGLIYGLTNAPMAPGSGGGGNSIIGHGGGAVRIDATGTVTINGTMLANGGSATSHGGGGSGGGIFISCADFTGASGAALQANGGNSAILVSNARAGSGGGGRIAVAVGMTPGDIQSLIDGDPVANLFYNDRYGNYTGTVSVIGGSPALDMIGDNSTALHKGEPGTFRFLTTSSDSTFWLLVQGDPEDYATASPHGHGLHAGLSAGAWVTNTAVSPFSEGNGIRRIALGWSVTNQVGTSLADGSGNQAVFQMETNLALHYHWTNAYDLSVKTANGSQGSVNSESIDDYYTNGVTVANITATPQAGYHFNRWFGEGVPEGQATDNPLSVVMTQPRSLIASFQKDGGEIRTWTGTGNWADTNRWTPTGIPGLLDDAHIASGTVTLSEPYSAGTLTVSNATTIVFTNWSTVLTVSNITVGGTLSLPPRFTDSDMSNRVHIVCTDFHLQSTGIIDGKGRGYSGSLNVYAHGHGPGRGRLNNNASHYGGGGGHGGAGGNGDSGPGGSLYGNINAPMAPGSGAAGNQSGAGGSAVRIDALGKVTIDGAIDVDGAKSTSHGGSGAGGSIFISCQTFEGAASGSLLARGADGNRVATSHGGAGGGGRIAVAIGMTAGDVQKLIDDIEIADLVITATHPAYAGDASVTNGIAQFDGHNHDGNPGTLRFLQVASGFSVLVRSEPDGIGSPTPRGYGLHLNIESGSVLTNSVSSPIDTGNGYGWAALGWSVTNLVGDIIAAGSDTQAVFLVTDNFTLLYHWTNVFDLTVTSADETRGSVNSESVNGWYTNGTVTAEITALPVAGYVFDRWTGIGVPSGQKYANPLIATMTEPRNLVANFALIGGETRIWSGTGNWIDTDKWMPPGIPGPEDEAVITSGSVTLAEPMTAGSLVISNGAAMVFTNWSTILTASDIVVEGLVTLPQAYRDGDMSNRVHFVCKTFKLAQTGVIDVKGRGYIGGQGSTSTDHGHGPGKGLLSPGQAHYGGGGGHGGLGLSGNSGSGGGIYGLTNAPLYPGSGGGGNMAGNGGGAVRIDATGPVVINGVIDASASNATVHGGGGSGGSIFISCARFSGAASGQLRSDGGNGNYAAAGAGAGGRIAVVMGFDAAYLQNLLAGQTTSFPVTTSFPPYLGTTTTDGGSNGVSDAENGTIRFIIARGTMFLIR